MCDATDSEAVYTGAARDPPMRQFGTLPGCVPTKAKGSHMCVVITKMIEPSKALPGLRVMASNVAMLMELVSEKAAWKEVHMLTRHFGSRPVTAKMLRSASVRSSAAQ